jgi:hypothetical protein
VPSDQGLVKWTLHCCRWHRSHQGVIRSGDAPHLRFSPRLSPRQCMCETHGSTSLRVCPSNHQWPVLIKLLWDHAIVVLRPRSLGSILHLLTVYSSPARTFYQFSEYIFAHSDLADWALPKVESVKNKEGELPVLVKPLLSSNGFVDTAAAGYQTFSTRCVNVKKSSSPEPPCCFQVKSSNTHQPRGVAM